jgi:hypothetical protein
MHLCSKDNVDTAATVGHFDRSRSHYETKSKTSADVQLLLDTQAGCRK